jgi:hypothetical protein
MHWAALIGVVFCVVGVQRLLLALAMPAGFELPALLFALVVVEAVAALVGGVGLLLRRRIALAGLLAFAVAAVLHMVADVAVYGVRSLLEGLAWAVVAVALAALGWLALQRPGTGVVGGGGGGGAADVRPGGGGSAEEEARRWGRA